MCLVDCLDPPSWAGLTIVFLMLVVALGFGHLDDR